MPLPKEQEAPTISTEMKKRPILLLALIVVIAAAGIFYWTQHRSKAPKTTAKFNTHLADYTDNDGTQSTVVLSGSVGDFGHAVRSTGQQAVMTLNLSHGTFKLDVTNLSKHFTKAVGQAAFNQATCSGNVSVADSVPIIANSGTGAYAGISGQFSLSMELDEIVPKQQNCSANNTLLNQAIITAGWGEVSLK